jgi:hypothetical protein
MKHEFGLMLIPADFVLTAQPFAHAKATLREATAIVQRRTLRGSRTPARLLEAANRARDEEFQRITQELRTSLQALRSAAASESKRRG